MFLPALILVALSLVDAPVAGQQQKIPLFPIEQDLLEKTNAERVKHGLPPVEIDATLQETCRQHCVWMAQNRSMVHGSYNCAEIIAAGQRSSTQAIASWMNSRGHRGIILGRYTKIGVAAYVSSNGKNYFCEQYR